MTRSTPGVGWTVAGCVLFIAVVLVAFVTNVTRETGPTAEQLKAAGVFLLPAPRELPEFALTDSEGQPFTRTSLQGRATLAFVGYTSCPDVCPTTMALLGEARRTFATLFAGARVLLITGDPERDTPERLRDYVRYFSADFAGVTGSREQLAILASAVNAAFAKVPGPTEDSYLVDHTANLILLDADGRYAGFVRYPQTLPAIELALQALTD